MSSENASDILALYAQPISDRLSFDEGVYTFRRHYSQRPKLNIRSRLPILLRIAGKPVIIEPQRFIKPLTAGVLPFEIHLITL
jgi:hypothetical protein